MKRTDQEMAVLEKQPETKNDCHQTRWTRGTI